MNIGTVFSGIGAPEQAFNGILGHNKVKVLFACDNGEIEIPLSKEQILEESKNFKSLEDCVVNIYSRFGINYMQRSYLANYKTETFYQDIRFIDGKKYKGKLDFYIGGSPCQSFSAMGHRKGLEDARGTLFYEYARIIKEASPKVFIYENVPGMMTLDNGKTWERILDIFESLGYNYSYAVLNSADYGIPQNRKRLYVVGIRKDLSKTKFIFPKGTKLAKKASDFYEDKIDPKYYFKKVGFRFITTHPGRAKINESIIRTEKANQQFNWNGDFVFEPIDLVRHKEALEYGAYIGVFKGQRGLARKLTPTECLNLMGFKDFKIVVDDHRMWRQAGNSMVVNVMEAIIKKVALETGLL